jgi:flagellar hook-associated protein 1 FlgK
MPLSTFLGVETALRGLLANQRAIDVTGHNIANANTVGYTRQQATFESTPPLRDFPKGDIGTGVEVLDYTRARDDFLDIQLRAQTMLQGYNQARQDGLGEVELAVNEPSDNGLSQLFSRFWSSWQDVANSPESTATRQALLQSAQSLAGGMQSLRGQLTQIDTDVKTNIGLTIGDLNSTVAAVTAIDQQIMPLVASGQQPSNDMLDRRDVLIDKLGSLVNLTTTKNADGSVTLQVGSFTLAQSGSQTTVAQLSDFGTNLTSGKLKGLDWVDQTIGGAGGYIARLDTVAGNVISSVNTAQVAGYTLAGTQTTEPFFTGADASNIAVNQNLVTNPDLIAAASAANAPGDGSNALAIAGLRDAPAIDGLYQGLVIGIGADSQDVQRATDNSNTLVDALNNRRDSVIGVSIDEEMTNMIRFQRGYQAAARALTAMDEMLDTLISRTGRVGL